MKTLTVSYLITFTLFLFSGKVIGQSWQARLGMNFSTFKIFDDQRSYNNYRMVKPGWNAGGVYEFFPGKLFSLETGLMLESKGEKRDNSYYAPADFTEVIGVTNLLYLDLFVMGKLNIPMKKSTFFAAAGPYIGLALAGWQESVTTPESNLDSRTAVDFGNKGLTSFRRFDYGGKALLGIEFKSYQFSIFYSAGAMDILRMDLEHHKTLNQSGGFTLGYRLGH
ncbi:MAG: PorT family protein [Bacteroidales bacterium]|nr:PorT family protein [Bacteroidales bacterium]